VTPFSARAALLAAALLAAAARAGAQVPADTAAAKGVSEGDAETCPDGVVSDVFIDNKSVFDVGSEELDPRFNWAYRLANGLHVRTKESVIRRELLFTEGDCYRPEELEDSERILRAASYIADADVFAVKQADGSYHVLVETRDEWSTRLEAQMEGGVGLRGVELREDNLLGTGQHVSAFYRDRYGESLYGASFGTRQLLGTRLDAEVAVARTPVGSAVSQRLAYPFRGEMGRWAFLQRFDHETDYFEVWRGDEDDVLRPYLFSQSRQSLDLGGVVRLGQRGNLTMFGLGVTGEWVVYPDGGRLIPRGGAAGADDEPEPIPVGLDSVSNLRVVFLAGQRNVRFDRRRALDAVRGTEDVTLGAEVELGIGRSLPRLSDDDDLALDFGVALAGDLPGGIFSGMRLGVEGRRDFEAPANAAEWRNVFGQLDLWAYWRPSPDSRHTWVAAATAGGGWHVDVPFQVTLGSRSGLRGFSRNEYAGQRRAVVTLENRAYLGWPFPRLFDLGSVVFVDAGRSWAGDDPFGRSSPVAVSAGFGLRAAFPPGSRRTYRLDVALPVAGGDGRRSLGITLGVGQAVGRGAVRDDPQIRRSSRRMLSASLFSFPN
jgi:hypothetical protein